MSLPLPMPLPEGLDLSAPHLAGRQVGRGLQKGIDWVRTPSPPPQLGRVPVPSPPAKCSLGGGQTDSATLLPPPNVCNQRPQPPPPLRQHSETKQRNYCRMGVSPPPPSLDPPNPPLSFTNRVPSHPDSSSNLNNDRVDLSAHQEQGAEAFPATRRAFSGVSGHTFAMMQTRDSHFCVLCNTCGSQNAGFFVQSTSRL